MKESPDAFRRFRKYKRYEEDMKARESAHRIHIKNIKKEEQKCEHHWNIKQCTVCWFKENPIEVPEIDWEKIDKAIEKAFEAPFPQIAVHHLVDVIIKHGPPKEIS